MIKVVSFRAKNFPTILKKFLRESALEYVYEEVDEDLYLNKCLMVDISSYNLIILSENYVLLKHKIAQLFSLKLEICKQLQESKKYYDKNSLFNDLENTVFDDYTLPSGFLPLLKNAFTHSFYGNLSGNLLVCLEKTEDSEIEGLLSVLKENIFFPQLVGYNCFKMFFSDCKTASLIISLEDLSCKGFRWAIFDDSEGVVCLYLYYFVGISNTTIVNIEKTIYSLWNENIYADFDASLEEVLVHLATLAQIKISTAESLTGGLVAEKIVSVAGASVIFDCGLISYSNEAKENLLGVDHCLFDKVGAVSHQVAEKMALDLIEKYNANLAISTTGIAGPTGQTEDKPLGLVYVGVATSYGGVVVKKYNFTGNRDSVRRLSANAGLFNAIKIIKKF